MKLAQRILLWSLVLSTFPAYAQNSVGIGVANPNKNAVLELISPGNNQGVLIPKLTTAQRTASSFTTALATKENGLMVFDSDDNMFYYWEATQWKAFGTTQDLELVGSTLTITGNPSATSIDLSPFTGTNSDDQTLTYNSGTGALSITRITGGPQTVTLSSAGTAGGDLTGSYPNPTVANNAINSAKIADGTVTSADVLDATIMSADILDGTIATGDLAADAVTSAKILDGTVTSADILDATVVSADVLDGTIATADLAADAVTSAKILDATITSADIFDGAVTSADILDGTVATADIAADAITTAKILDGTVTTNDILNATITSTDIANNTITGANILDGTVANIDLGVSSVSSANIIDGTIALIDLAANSVATGNIIDGTIANIDLAANSVASANIIDGTIVSADLAVNSIASTNIIDGTITDADISSTTHIDVAKLSIGTNGQVLTTSGTSAQWADPSGSVLINNAGTHNLFAGASVGSPAGAGATDNTFYGYSAGAVNTVNGQWNVAVGAQAGYRNINGDLNTLVGWLAGSAVTNTGFNGCVFVGAQAGKNTTDGPSVFIGEQSGLNNISGTKLVFVGNSTGLTNIVGANNTLIGYGSDVSTDPLSNATAIGFQAIVDASNKVRIGNASVSVIQGQVGFTAASDRRLKTNIQSLTAGLDFINQLKPVSYIMKDLDDKRTNWGFIAQDIETLLGTSNAILTVNNDKDRTLGLRYTDFVAPLVKAVQEQQVQIEDLNNKLSESEQKYETLAAELEQIRKAIGLKADSKN